MEILITGLIIMLLLTLVAIGTTIIMQKKMEEVPTASIHHSGVYSLIRKSPREEVIRTKPSAREVLEHLQTHHAEKFSADEMQNLAEKWEKSLEKSIIAIEIGDSTGVQTYRFRLSPSDLKVCTFLSRETYITREQIYNHPELLPPYYIGCDAEITNRAAWDESESVSWKPLLPVNGAYALPDWRSLA
jgi:hypothetical protein